MSDNIDPVHYAKSLLGSLQRRPANFSFPVPIGRLRILCQAVLDTAQEKDRLPPLTDVERSVLTAIKADIAQGIKPTVRSVQDRLQYKSSNSARVAIDRLIKLGYIERSGSKRQIVVVTQPH